MHHATTIAGIVALLFSGAMAGLYFAFSNNVMPGLTQAGPLTAVRAMQAINRVILNPLFLLLFMGLPVPALVAAILSLMEGATLAVSFYGASALIAFFGNLVITVARNVPMNNVMEATQPQSDAEAEPVWRAYAGPWTRWNDVRAVACLIALALAGAGLAVGH